MLDGVWLRRERERIAIGWYSPSIDFKAVPNTNYQRAGYRSFIASISTTCSNKRKSVPKSR